MKLPAAVALVVAACGNSSTPPPPPITPRPPPADAASGLLDPGLPARAMQLVVAVTDDWDATTAQVRLWNRLDGTWHAMTDPWPAVVGSTGLAWGNGIHGMGAPAGHGGPRKHEGDRKSPAGTFYLRDAYGYAAKPPAGTTLPYTATDATWVCVDDPASNAYASIVERTKLTVDWKSAEQMHRDDVLYTWVVDIAHNATHIPGDGSCIFFHVWSGPSSTTVGCTAMAEPKLARLLQLLDPAASPVYVVLPRAEYQALAGPWGLPPL